MTTSEQPTRWSTGRRVDVLRDALHGSVRDYALVLLDADGTIVDWNTGAVRLFGRAAADAVGTPFADVFAPADPAAGDAERDLAVALAEGSHSEESWRRRANGDHFWASTVIVALRGADERLLGFGVICRDLTEHRRGDELLRESEERFRLLVNSVADYAIFLLDDEGRVTSWNLGAERLKGYRPDEIIGRHFSTFYTSDDAREEIPASLLRRARESGRVETEGWRVRRDGSQFWASVVITALHAPDGTPRGFAKVTKDLTDRKRNEDALRGVLEREREAAAQLRELDQMRSDIVGVVAHDLRAPLTVVQGLVQAACEDWPALDDAAKLDHIQRISARLEGMSALVDELFDMTRIEAGHLHTEQHVFDLTAIAERAIADGVTAADLPRVALDGDAQVMALGDSHRTWEVVVNLLSNAIKFSPPGTPVCVSVRRLADGVELAVADAGPGVPEERRHLLFQRFTRLSTDRRADGAGIGLYIARSLVEAQGGRIGMRPQPRGGSTFWFTLPAPA